MRYIKLFEDKKYFKKYVIITSENWAIRFYMLKLFKQEKNIIWYNIFYYYDENFNLVETHNKSNYDIIVDEIHVLYDTNNIEDAIRYLSLKIEVEKDSNKFNL